MLNALVPHSGEEGDYHFAALRHERQSIAMALAESQHHTSRGQKMARAVGERSTRSTTRYGYRSPLLPGVLPAVPDATGGRRTEGGLLGAPGHADTCRAEGTTGAGPRSANRGAVSPVPRLVDR